MSCRRARSCPSTAAVGIVSFIRLMQRRKVDLPQPEGPIRAVTCACRDVEVDVVQRLLGAVIDVDVAGASILAAGCWLSVAACVADGCAGHVHLESVRSMLTSGVRSAGAG